MSEKPFKTIEEQIQILKRRNLIIANEESARIVLQRYGYYEVINGYKNHFMISNDDEDGFKPGITFEHIARLQQFDRSIRFSVINSLELFEENLRQAVAYVISKNISDKQDIYINRKNYNTGHKYTKYVRGRPKEVWPIDDTIRLMKKVVQSDKQPVKHYRDRYANVPPWILVKELSFGSLIWLFQLLKKREKSEVLSIMFDWDVALVDSVMEKAQLKKWFHELMLLYLSYRNTASHGGRMYNHSTKKYELSYNGVMSKLIGVTAEDYKAGKGRSRVGVVLESLRLFSDQRARIELEVGIQFAIDDYLKTYPDDASYLSKQMEYEIPKEFNGTNQ